MNLSFLRIFHFFIFWNAFTVIGLFGNDGSIRLENVRDDLSHIVRGLKEVKAEMDDTDSPSLDSIVNDENKTLRGKKNIPAEYSSDKIEDARIELRQILDEIKMELPLLKKNLNLAYEESSKINGHNSESSNEKKEVIQKDPSEAIGHSSIRVTRRECKSYRATN